jgi:hypothetical protein
VRTQTSSSKNKKSEAELLASRFQETKPHSNITGPGETSVSSHDEITVHIGHYIHQEVISERKRDVNKRH